MQQPPPDTHKPRALAVWVLASVWLTSCVKQANDPDCVNVGMGWHACSGEMTSAKPNPDAGADAATQASLAESGTSGHASVQTGSPRANNGGSGTSLESGSSGNDGRSMANENGGSASGVEMQAGSGDGASSAAANSGGASRDDAGNAAPLGGRGGGGKGEKASAGGGGFAAHGGSPAGTGAEAGHGDLPDTCCHSLGICVNGSKLSADQRGLLLRDSCSDAMLCTPTGLLDEPSYVPRSCHSALQAEGRCLPECMANLATQAEHFPQDVCDAHELCAPCFDPLTGNATGFCSLGADKGPSNLPQVFGSCCGTGTSSAGLCVPSSYVPKGGVTVRADCNEGLFCVPRAQVEDPSAKLAQCTGEVRGAGVCLPQCIADSIQPIIVTIQADCNASEICYPCQLADGTNTGACGAP